MKSIKLHVNNIRSSALLNTSVAAKQNKIIIIIIVARGSLASTDLKVSPGRREGQETLAGMAFPASPACWENKAGTASQAHKVIQGSRVLRASLVLKGSLAWMDPRETRVCQGCLA